MLATWLVTVRVVACGTDWHERASLDKNENTSDDDQACNFLGGGGVLRWLGQRWMGWTIGRQTNKQCGTPKGLPCLTGFVIHCEIVEEAMAD
jgi:hypothetical protein